MITPEYARELYGVFQLIQRRRREFETVSTEAAVEDVLDGEGFATVSGLREVALPSGSVAEGPYQ